MSDKSSAEQAPAGQAQSKIIDPSNRELVIDELRSQLAESRRCHKVQFDANVEMQKDLSRVELLLGIDPHGSESLIDGVRRIKAGHKLEVESHLATHAREDEALAQLSTTREILENQKLAHLHTTKLWEQTRARILELDKEVDATREIARELAAALHAAKVQWDRGPCPRKLDEMLTWRECDEKATKIVDTALAKARAAGLLDAQRPAEGSAEGGKA